MNAITLSAFVFVMAVHTRGLVRALISIAWPAHRRWPPPLDAPPQSPLRQRLTSATTALGTPLVAILDWNSFVFDHPARFFVAVALIGLGSFPALAHRQLGTSESLGQAKPGRKLVLETEGPYAFSRNPQYVGAVAVYLGIAVGANSILGGISALWMICGLVANVFAEEPWMQEKFGAAYEEYCQRVPRFVPMRWKDEYPLSPKAPLHQHRPKHRTK